MSKMKKRITVRFFSIEANDEFFDDFVASLLANYSNDKPVRIFNLRDKKHLIKIYNPVEYRELQIFFLSVVRERITWQATALADGTISPIHLNQGILGDLFYYLVIPSHRRILGFTAGPSASIRTVANAALQQFKKDRTANIALEPLSKENEYAKLNDFAEFLEMRFRLTPTALVESGDDMPSIFRELRSSPFLASSSKMELTVSGFGVGGLSHEDFHAAVDYLADNDACTALYIKGVDHNGEKIELDLNKTYLSHTTYVHIRENFIEEKLAKDIFFDALNTKNSL